MPQFTSVEQKIVPSGQTAGTKVSPGLFAPQVQADRAIAGAVRNIGKTAGVFAEKIVVAKENSDVRSGVTQFREGMGAKLLDFERRNDHENFEKEFDETEQKLTGDILKGKSKGAQRRLELELNDMRSRNRLEAQSIFNQKEVDKLRANYFTNRNSLIEAGDLEGANELTEENFSDNVINPLEKERDLKENREVINFNNARDAIRLNPDNADSIMEEFPQTKANKERLERFAKDTILEREAKRDKVLEGHINESMLDPDFDRDELIDIIDRNVAVNGYDQTKAAGFKDMIIKKDEARRNKKFKPDPLRVAQGSSRINTIKRLYRLKKISRAEAHSATVKTMKDFAPEIDSGALNEAFTLFDSVVGDIETNTESLRAEADKAFDNLPLGLRGESITGQGRFGPKVASTEKELREARDARGQAIAKADPEDRPALITAFNKDEEDRLSTVNKLEKDIELWIKTNPEATVPELNEQIKKLTEAPLKKEAFKKVAGIFGDIGNFIFESFANPLP